MASSVVSRVELLRRSPLFNGLSRGALERIARVAHEFEAPAGQVLIEPRQAATGMFVLGEGKAVVQARGKRRELKRGDVFGELALLRPDSRRSARVQATTAVRCLAIARSDLRQLLEREPKIAIGLLELALARLDEAR